MSKVSFPGEPPFYLPTAQNASATALGETVELTLRAAVIMTPSAHRSRSRPAEAQPSPRAEHMRPC
jgi:hypothetical protein